MKLVFPDTAGTKASGLKYMSYFGAVMAHAGHSHASAYDRSGQAYVDPTNKVYAYVLDKVWPTSLRESGISNPGKKGDLLESFLGLGWFMGHPDNPQSGRYHFQLAVCYAVHKVIAYTYDNWSCRDSLAW